jgi:preprotein translocase subunit SecA
VLNAKYHAQEAEFVAQAGRKGTVTIATNMAGRGTDILLGGNPEFMARQQLLGEQKAERLPKGEERFTDDDEFVYFYHLDGFYRATRADWDRVFSHFKRQTDAEHEEVVSLGGLHIIGTERHEARRIDNQLRGRAGRQGDPGSSRFYLSLEDDLMRIFGSDRISGLMQRLGMEEGVPIEHGMVTRAIERAQKQVEAQNFGTRKHLLEYDDVMNKQRENIYALRRELLEGKIRVEDEEAEEVKEIDTRAYLMMLGEDVVADAVEAYAGKDTDPEEWDLDALKMDMSRVFGLDAGDYLGLDFGGMSAEEIRDEVWARIVKKYDTKEQTVGMPEMMRQVERFVMLETVDRQWKDHLYSLDHLKEGIGKLRAVPGHEAPCRRRHGEQAVDRPLRRQRGRASAASAAPCIGADDLKRAKDRAGERICVGATRSCAVARGAAHTSRCPAAGGRRRRSGADRAP